MIPPSHWTAVVCYIHQAKKVGKGLYLVFPTVEADMTKNCKTGYQEETWPDENVFFSMKKILHIRKLKAGLLLISGK